MRHRCSPSRSLLKGNIRAHGPNPSYLLRRGCRGGRSRRRRSLRRTRHRGPASGHHPVQGRQLGRRPGQLRRRRAPALRLVDHRQLPRDVQQGEADHLGFPRQPRGQHRPASHQPVHGERQLLGLLPGGHRRGLRPGLQGDRFLLGGNGRAQGRPDRRHHHLLAHVEQSRRHVQERPAGLLRAHERAARLHRDRVGRPGREVAGHLPPSRATGSSSAAPATTTTSPPSAPTRAWPAPICRCTTTASGSRTPPTTSGSPTSRNASATAPAGRSRTSSAPR